MNGLWVVIVIRINRTKLNEICIFHFGLSTTLHRYHCNYIRADVISCVMFMCACGVVFLLRSLFACIWLVILKMDCTGTTTSFAFSLYRGDFFFVSRRILSLSVD